MTEERLTDAELDDLQGATPEWANEMRAIVELRELRASVVGWADKVANLLTANSALRAENAKVLDENERLRRQFVPLSLRTGGLAEAVAFMEQSSATIAAIHERERALEAEVAKLRAALADYYNQAATIWLLAQTVQQVTGQPLFTAGNNAAEGLR